MTGTALNVIAEDRWLTVQDVGEFIIHSVSLMRSALKMLFLHVQFAGFVTQM